MRLLFLCALLSVSGCTCNLRVKGRTEHVIKVEQPDGGAVSIKDLVDSFDSPVALDAGVGGAGFEP